MDKIWKNLLITMNDKFLCDFVVIYEITPLVFDTNNVILVKMCSKMELFSSWGFHLCTHWQRVHLHEFYKHVIFLIVDHMHTFNPQTIHSILWFKIYYKQFETCPKREKQKTTFFPIMINISNLLQQHISK